MSGTKASEILINHSHPETRVALIENGFLQEIHLERVHERGLIGNIYKGKVTRVLPGMQAAFVDIGLEKAGFLHVSDVMTLRKDEQVQNIDLNSPEADIRRWLYEGQEVLVQVVKDPMGSKGARLSTHLSVLSRYLVYMPDLKHIGISLRLDDPEERERLQAVMAEALDVEVPEGYIVRTVAENATDAEIKRDIKFLKKLWKSVKHKAKKVKKTGLVFEDLPLYLRAVRDMVNDNIERVMIDDESSVDELHQFAKDFVPEIASKIELYQGESLIFELYGIEDELKKALKNRVSLKSGGYVVFDQTEAMTTIDVNTGNFVGSRNFEETFFKTNLEAAQTIARQLRLRNLGGIIIIDFIDMQEEDHKQQVLSTLEKVLAKDPAKTFITQVSSLGLVEMTRKRTYESLWQKLCEPCPQCEGRGRIKTIDSMVFDIMRELQREARAYDPDGFMVLASQKVIDSMMNEHSVFLGELETQIGVPIKLKTEPHFSQEQFDIILV